MIVGYMGSLGAGKTLTMTAIGAMFADDLTTVSNYHTDYTDRTVSNPVELDEASTEMVGQQLLDEVWAWADSRKSGNNDVFNNIVINSRKRGWVVHWTAQSDHMVDKRLRGNTDLFIVPTHHETPTVDYVEVTVIDKHGRVVRSFRFIADYFYDIYDTREEVSTKNEREMYDDLIESIKDRVRDGEFNYKKEVISHLHLEHGISKSTSEMMADEIFRQLEDDENESVRTTSSDRSADPVRLDDFEGGRG